MSEKKQWFENENFWNNYGPIMFDANRWAEAPAVAESVCKIAGLKKRKRNSGRWLRTWKNQR